MTPFRSLGSCLLGALASAVLLLLCLPGAGVWWLGFAAPLPWAVSSEAAPRRPWLVDGVFALSFLTLTIWWIGYVSWVGAIFVVLIESALMLPLGWLYRRLRIRLPATLALPLAWCAVEFLRMRYPYGGVPLSVLGFSQASNALLRQTASALGVAGVSFVLAACSGLIVDLLGFRLGTVRRTPGKTAALAAAAVAALGAWSFFPFPALPGYEKEEPGPQVVGIQPNILSLSKADGPSQEEIFEKHVRLSRQAVARGEPDLLIWSETMFPWPLGDERPDAVFLEGSPPYTGADAKRAEEGLRAIVFRDLLPRGKGAFLFGAVYYAEAEGRFLPHNSALLYDTRGRRAGLYHKIHLVPGGEFVPELGPISWLAEALSSLEGFRGEMGALRAGSEVRVFPLETPRGSWRFGVSICYDNAYADVYRRAALDGADFHVVLSNEDWYRDSSAMDQLLAACVFRAVETGRPVLRVTNSGISALVSASGEVLAAVEAGGRRKQVEGALSAQIPVRRGLSPNGYLLWGDAPWWGACLAALILALWKGKKMETPAGKAATEIDP